MFLKFRCAWRVATHHTFADHGPKATRERPENPTGVSRGAEQPDNLTTEGPDAADTMQEGASAVTGFDMETLRVRAKNASHPNRTGRAGVTN